MFYWLMRDVFPGPLLRLYFRPWVVGRENVPDKGPVIIASNHLAVIDSFALPLVLRRKIVFIGKSEYFTGKGIKGRFVAAFMKGIGTIPVDRSGGKAGEAALRTGLARLEEGGVFGIYPEGTRSPDGRLYRGKTGVARLALTSGAPVVPLAMIDTAKAQPLGKRVPKHIPIGLVFGEPMTFEEFRGASEDRFVLRSVTDQIMFEIQRLSGQPYVDGYAASQKARIASGQPLLDEADPPVSPGGGAQQPLVVPQRPQ